MSVGPELLEKSLELATTHNNADAARGALASIWQVGNRRLLAQGSTLWNTLSHPDHRIQLAAANAILNLGPAKGSFGGAQLVGVLQRALRSDGKVKCLIVDPNQSRANTMATLLLGLDYGAETAQTGREGFRKASELGDVNLILVHANSVRWALSETVANLRADSRTAGLPIVVYGPAFVAPRISNMLNRYSQITFIEESEEAGEASERFVQLKLKPFFESTLPQLSEEELSAQKIIAADWLAQLAGPRRDALIDMSSVQKALRASATDGMVTRQCATAIGSIPTASAQLDLQELVVDQSLAEEGRLAVINELAFHVQRNGVLLGIDKQMEIVRMADSVANTGLGNAAAALVGSLQPTAQDRFKRLQRFRPRR